MKFLADESVDFQIVRELRNSGHEVISVSEKFSGLSDEEVLDLSNKMKMILLTEDKDFGEIAIRMKKRHQGIVLIRLSGVNPKSKTQIVLNALNQTASEIEKSFTVISEFKIRLRKS